MKNLEKFHVEKIEDKSAHTIWGGLQDCEGTQTTVVYDDGSTIDKWGDWDDEGCC